MRIGKLKKAWTIMQVLEVFDEHKQDYIDQHDYYRAGDFEHVRNHIGRQFSIAVRAGEDADKCLIRQFRFLSLLSISFKDNAASTAER